MTAYHGTECVRGFANIELLMIPLALSCSHVIDDRIAPDMLHGTLLGYTEARLANDDTKLALIVSSLGELRMWIDVFAIGNDRREALREYHGVRWLIDLV